MAGIFVFCFIVNRLDYIYANDSEWERNLWHYFYEDKGKIDNLYLGSSHVYHDINPFLLDELNGRYNFSLASPSQVMNGTYYLLREADRENKLSHVYIELYYSPNTKINFEGNREPIEKLAHKNWQNTDYMKFSMNKLAYQHSIADVEKYVDICIPFSRYRANLDDWETIKKTVADKSNHDYINFGNYHRGENENGYDEFWGKGFRYSTKVYKDANRIYRQERILGEEPMAESSEYYLCKAIEYCQGKDIPVTLFVSPIYELQMVSTENYDNYLAQIRGIADKYNVELYDFNLAKEEYLPIQDTKYFRDIGHLNSVGADMYTEFFHRVVSGNELENKAYFYESYAEKLENTAPAIYGIYYREADYREAEQETGETAQIKNMWVASNRNDGMEYRIILTPDEKEQYMVQDFSENKMFAIDSSEHGICTVVYRMKDTPDMIGTMEINY